MRFARWVFLLVLPLVLALALAEPTFRVAIYAFGIAYGIGSIVAGVWTFLYILLRQRREPPERRIHLFHITVLSIFAGACWPAALIFDRPRPR